MNVPPPSSSTRFGFTLVELLVVIAVVGILTAILLPAINGWRTISTRAQSTSNLRQLAAGLNLFANDNEGHYPGPGSSWQSRWMHQTAVYLGYPADPAAGPGGYPVYGDAYHLPIFHNPLTPPEDWLATGGGSRGLYGLNDAICKEAKSSTSMLGANRNVIVNPSRTVLLAELAYTGSGTVVVHPERPYPLASNGAAANWRSDRLPENGPDGLALYAFADGHVSLLEKWPGAKAFELYPAE